MPGPVITGAERPLTINGAPGSPVGRETLEAMTPMPTEPAITFPDAKQWAELTKAGAAAASQPTSSSHEGGASLTFGDGSTELFSKAIDASGREAVELAVMLRQLKDASRRGNEAAAVRRACGKTFVLWRGVWIDQAFEAKLKRVEVQYLGGTYLKILLRQPKWKSIFALGQCLVVVTPSNTVLVIGEKADTELTDKEIAALFVPAKAEGKK